MVVTKSSPLTGDNTSYELPVTQEELYRHHKGELAQSIWPSLEIWQREFLISGMNKEEQEEMFKEEE